jgi:exopolyphosphatase/guanosine-5'-triphosphate,3'-diphosphate pyrophosphatase
VLPIRLRNRIRPGMDQRRAIIDIGSNTVRLVIYAGPPRAPSVVFNEKVTAKLGKAVAETGLLSDKATGTALSALARYAALLEVQGITGVEIVATAASRDAANGPEFLAKIAALGLSPRLLSGQEEAVTSAWGVLAAFPGAHGIVADLGGGSLELTDIAGDSCEHGVSFPWGSLRLRAMRAAGPQKFARHIKRELNAVGWGGRKGLALFLVGGSCRALAQYAKHVLAWPIDDPHGFELPASRALALFRPLEQGQLDTAIPGVSSSRLAALPDAAALVVNLVRELKPSKLVFSSWGLREGLLYRKLSPKARAEDVMLAGVTAFAEDLGTPAATALMIADWTAEAAPAADPARETLRIAATALALASLRLEPNLRAEHTVDWALRKRWIGLDVEGRAMLAATLLANSGKLTVPEGVARIASLGALREAVAWGLAVRLARKLSGCSRQPLAGSALTRSSSKLVLSVRGPFQALVTDTIEKDLRQLAAWLTLTPEIAKLSANASLP